MGILNNPEAIMATLHQKQQALEWYSMDYSIKFISVRLGVDIEIIKGWCEL